MEKYNTLTAFAGAVIGFLFGDMTGLMIALVVFMAFDYVTGVAKGIVQKNLSSAIGFKGLVKKFIIMIIVSVAHLIDVYVIGDHSVVQSAAILFYISNEGISILENAAMMEIPLPKKLLDILKQIKSDSEADEKTEKKDGGE